MLFINAKDLKSEDSRAKERYRLAGLSIGANLISRLIAILVMVFSVSLTAPYLGAERFGLWMTIASFIGVMSFLDLGVGNAIANRVSLVNANQKESLEDTISGGIGFIVIISMIATVFMLVLTYFLPWDYLIKFNDKTLGWELNKALIVFSICFGLNLISNGIQKIYFGLQNGYVVHIYLILGSIISFLAIFIFSYLKMDIPYLLGATLGGPIISSFLLAVLLIKKRRLKLINLKENIKIEAKHLLNSGILFLVLQVGVVVGWGADVFLVSNVLGVLWVAPFAIVQKMFQAITQPTYIFNSPLWSAYADAHVKGEKEFISITLKRSLKITFFYAFSMYIIILFVGQTIIGKWTSSAINVPFELIAIYGIWSIIDSLGNALAMFLNGCNIVKQQVYAVVTLCLFAIPIKLFLIHKYGLNAMLAGFILCYVIVFGFYYGFVFNKSIRNFIF